MYIPRSAEESLLSLAKGYPVLVLTGPRQSGKSTLVKKVFTERPYISLEDLDNREFAQTDPRGFLRQFPDGAVLDEVQRCPDLLSYLQTLVDHKGQPGQYILTGSQQFGLLSDISQSLAGRSALVSLLPFSLAELQNVHKKPDCLEDLLFKGLYPPVHDHDLQPEIWYGNYVQTYIERDVRQMINVRDLGTFHRFLRLCAGRVGQLVNLSSLANDCGITHNTAKSWLSVLEASYIIFLLAPHHRNFNKQIIKTPKLYFTDPGLACWLLGLQKAEQLQHHAYRGPLFETWVLSELLKCRYNKGLVSNLYFWRDKTGNEVDLLVDRGASLTPIEVKSGLTIASSFFRGLRYWTDLAGSESGQPYLVYAGDDQQKRSQATVFPWFNVSGLCRELEL